MKRTFTILRSYFLVLTCMIFASYLYSQTAFITNISDNTVSVINTADNKVIKTITVGIRPGGVSVNGDGSRVYVANYDANTVSVINTADNTVIKAITVGFTPTAFGNFISSYKQPTAVVNIENTDIEVYPNPTSGQINFSKIQVDKIEVYDNIGKLILSKDKPGNSIDISDSPSGLYNVKMQVGDKSYSAKIIKK